MAQITIEFETNNDAFTDGNLNHEVARILSELVRVINTHGIENDYIIIRDLNGNKVGRMEHFKD